MKDGFEKGLLEYSSNMKRGFSFMAENSGKIIALITAACAVLFTFTEVEFFGVAASDFTATLLVLLFSGYIIYFSLADAGERLGESTDEYKAALEKYNSSRARIQPEMLPALRKFCSEYSAAELEYRREALLLSMGFAPEEFKSAEAADLSREARRASRAAGRLRVAQLSPRALLSGSERRESELSDPERGKILRLSLRLLPSTLCMILTASFILTARADLSATAVIDGIIKLAALPALGFRGYEAGFSFAVGEKLYWLETKTRLIECFLSAYAAKNIA